MRLRPRLPALILATAAIVFLSAACTGRGSRPCWQQHQRGRRGRQSAHYARRGRDQGWERTGPPDRYAEDGLYGYIDGGAEIVLEYGFLRALRIPWFKPAADSGLVEGDCSSGNTDRMKRGTSAFGLYSTKLEGEEKGWPEIKVASRISPGQANLVKGDYLVNILAPECTDGEIGPFMAAVDLKLPAAGPSGRKGWTGCRARGWSLERTLHQGPGRGPRRIALPRRRVLGFGGPEAGKSATEAYLG